MCCLRAVVLFVVSVLATFCVYSLYTPDWASLDTRPIPLWYDEAKVGIFVNWGVYTVPGMTSEWFWYYWASDKKPEVLSYMKDNYPPNFQYAEFAPDLKATFFNASQYVDLVRQSGARYIVHCTKHHEGFTLYPSNTSWNWNSVDVGAGRDIVGELAQAFKTANDLRFGIYFSLFEWYNPIYLADKANGYKTQDYVKSVSMPQLLEIVNEYHPEVIFSDGDWEANDTYWNSTEFLAWLYNESPVKDTIVVNDRWGRNTNCAHGDTFSCNDRYQPGILQKHKWVNAMTLDVPSWGYRRDMNYADVLTIEDLISTMAETVSCGGNILMNVGPTVDGTIDPIFQERLQQMGQWLGINGEAIYATKAWIYQNDTTNANVWYTSQVRNASKLDPRRMFNPQDEENTIVYAIVLKWPKSGMLQLGAPSVTEKTAVSLVGYAGKMPFEPLSMPTPNTPNGRGIAIDFSGIPYDKLPSTWTWVIKLEYLATEQKNPLIHAI